MNSLEIKHLFDNSEKFFKKLVLWLIMQSWINAETYRGFCNLLWIICRTFNGRNNDFHQTFHHRCLTGSETRFSNFLLPKLMRPTIKHHHEDLAHKKANKHIFKFLWKNGTVCSIKHWIYFYNAPIAAYVLGCLVKISDLKLFRNISTCKFFENPWDFFSVVV